MSSLPVPAPRLDATPKLTKGGLFFMMLPVLLLGAGVLGWIFMMRAAVNDPSFGIEPDYYKKASKFDGEKESVAKSGQLGWHTTLRGFTSRSLAAKQAGAPSRATAAQEGSTMVSEDRAELALSFEEPSGAQLLDLNVEVTAFPNARSADRQTVHLSRDPEGVYRGYIARPRLGIWELRVVAQRAEQVFQETVRVELEPREETR